MNTCPCCKEGHDGLCSIVSNIANIVNGIDEISGQSISGEDGLCNIVKLLVKSNNDAIKPYHGIDLSKCTE